MNNNLLYYCLKKVYTSVNINPSIKVETFNPLKQEISPSISINGLYTNGHYVNKGYKTLTNICIINFNDLGYNINIKVYFSNKLNNIKYIIQEIICRVYTMLYLFETEKIDYEIVMLLYELPRIILCKYNKARNEINTMGELGYFNCTNGYYQRQSNKKFILVTRFNDSMGLLIHELSHAVGNDIGAYDTFKQWYSYYTERFNGKSGYFTEGINNATASIIHCMLLSIKYNINFYKIFNEEVKYVYDECCKLISFYIKDTNIKDVKINDLKHIYTQDSQMFEYNILRYIYLYHCDVLYNFKNINQLSDNEKQIIKSKIPQGFCNKIMFIYSNNEKNMKIYYDKFIEYLEKISFKIDKLKPDYNINNKNYFSMEYFKYNFNV